MFDDVLVYVLQYAECMTKLFLQEVNTVYEIFDKDVVCQVIVALIDRVFNDQTLGVQYLLQTVNGQVRVAGADPRGEHEVLQHGDFRDPDEGEERDRPRGTHHARGADAAGVAEQRVCAEHGGDEGVG